MVCATISLAYPKDHIFALRPTYILHVVMMSPIQNLLQYSLTSHSCVTFVTMSYDL